MESLIQLIYDLIGIQRQVDLGDVWGFISVSIILLAAITNFLSSAPPQLSHEEREDEKTPASEVEKAVTTKEEIAEEKVEAVEQKAEVIELNVEAAKVSWSERLKKGLSRSRQEVWGKLHSVLSGQTLTDETLEEVEELLYSADIGAKTVSELIDVLHERVKSKEVSEEDLKEFLYEFLSSKMQTVQKEIPEELYQFNPQREKKLEVIMVVGVNGAGKTTTIGKLATKLTKQGAKVVVGACDTFRAAAVDQLQVWCDRAGAQMIRAKEGSNPSGVGYEALETAINENADYCILDTAGRLHTKGNLMEELTKSKKVLSKLDPNAPHHVLLVIDAITGQNALRQAQEFNKALSLTGLIFTKCDGSSKAGSAVSIVEELKVPIAYIGVGENVEDLDIFNLEEYLGALLDR